MNSYIIWHKFSHGTIKVSLSLVFVLGRGDRESEDER